MQKRPKKRWLATARRQKYFRTEVTALPSNEQGHLSSGDWITTTGQILVTLIPITEKEHYVLYIEASKTRLKNGAHSQILQYPEGGQGPSHYSYLSGCTCNKCTPKDWYWRAATKFMFGRWEYRIRDPKNDGKIKET